MKNRKKIEFPTKSWCYITETNLDIKNAVETIEYHCGLMYSNPKAKTPLELYDYLVDKVAPYWNEENFEDILSAVTFVLADNLAKVVSGKVVLAHKGENYASGELFVFVANDNSPLVYHILDLAKSILLDKGGYSKYKVPVALISKGNLSGFTLTEEDLERQLNEAILKEDYSKAKEIQNRIKNSNS